jgi:hypothetical protein
MPWAHSKYRLGVWVFQRHLDHGLPGHHEQLNLFEYDHQTPNFLYFNRDGNNVSGGSWQFIWVRLFWDDGPSRGGVT